MHLKAVLCFLYLFGCSAAASASAWNPGAFKFSLLARHRNLQEEDGSEDSTGDDWHCIGDENVFDEAECISETGCSFCKLGSYDACTENDRCHCQEEGCKASGYWWVQRGTEFRLVGVVLLVLMVVCTLAICYYMTKNGLWKRLCSDFGLLGKLLSCCRKVPSAGALIPSSKSLERGLKAFIALLLLIGLFFIGVGFAAGVREIQFVGLAAIIWNAIIIAFAAVSQFLTGSVVGLLVGLEQVLLEQLGERMLKELVERLVKKLVQHGIQKALSAVDGLDKLTVSMEMNSLRCSKEDANGKQSAAMHFEYKAVDKSKPTVPAKKPTEDTEDPNNIQYNQRVVTIEPSVLMGEEGKYDLLDMCRKRAPRLLGGEYVGKRVLDGNDFKRELTLEVTAKFKIVENKSSKFCSGSPIQVVLDPNVEGDNPQVRLVYTRKDGKACNLVTCCQKTQEDVESGQTPQVEMPSYDQMPKATISEDGVQLENTPEDQVKEKAEEYGYEEFEDEGDWIVDRFRRKKQSKEQQHAVKDEFAALADKTILDGIDTAPSVQFLLKEAKKEAAKKRKEEGKGSGEVKEGEVTISLEWQTTADICLYVVTPSKEVIYYQNRNAGGGELDVDANIGSKKNTPVENTVIENVFLGLVKDTQVVTAAPRGEYKVYVKNYTDATVPFTIAVTKPGVVSAKRLKHNSEIKGTAQYFNDKVKDSVVTGEGITKPLVFRV